MIVVLMGVSGIGKTTIGKLLALRTGWKFEDADDYHSEEHRRKMAAAIPLTDADRLPWLTALNERMMQYRQREQSAILACSALKEKYREVLARGFSKDEMVFVYLHASAALIKERVAERYHPFMSAALLDSQLAALEVPSDAWAVLVDGTPEEAVDDIVARLRKAGVLTAGAEK
ncbi:MAG TPA: gluconokinase, GntK/IdnK-type [Terriglobales bacterium]